MPDGGRRSVGFFAAVDGDVGFRLRRRRLVRGKTSCVGGGGSVAWAVRLPTAGSSPSGGSSGPREGLQMQSGALQGESLAASPHL